MTTLVTSPIDGQPIAPLRAVDGNAAADVIGGPEPVILKGIAADWPIITQTRGEDRAMVDALVGYAQDRPLNVLVGDPKAGGRFFYNAEMNGFNFMRRSGPARAVFAEMLRFGERDAPPHIYAGSVPAGGTYPGFAEANPMPLVPARAEPRIWAGNPSRIAPHYDSSNNLAVCVHGPREFLLFPPDQIGNLYVGPWDNTMAGQPASLVDPQAPDLERFPDYATAREHALLASLEPGDAVYMPPLWWHYVQADGDFNVLVNYWWQSEPMLPAIDALAHAMLVLRELPHAERQAWRAHFDHYVFSEGAEAAADHIPEHARGVLSQRSPGRDRYIADYLGKKMGEALG